jgi:hypothetical protein
MIAFFEHPASYADEAYTREHQTEIFFLLIAHDMDGDSTLDWDYTEPWLI